MGTLLWVVTAIAWSRSLTSGQVISEGQATALLQPTVIGTVRDDFLSFTIDASVAYNDWGGLDFSSERLETLVRGLQPATLRFGGTKADCLIFTQPVSEYSELARCKHFKKWTKPFELTVAAWAPLRNFLNRLGLPLVFDLNSLLRDDAGRWNDTNARHAIATLRAELTLPTVWQLSNEPNYQPSMFNYSVPPETLAGDFLRLRKLLGQDAQLVGPDVTRPKVSGVPPHGPLHSSVQYLETFLETGLPALDAVAFHQYYVNGNTANLSDFLQPSHMDVLATQIAVVRQLAGDKPVWLTETGSAYSGGGGAAGLSDAYVAGFFWLDKLGVAAREGVQLVARQSLYSGHYAMLDEEMRPNPDYWLARVYKLTVGPRVLPVTVSGPDTLRMYCHCGHRSQPADSVTCFTLNLRPDEQTVLLDDTMQGGGSQYMLTPPDGNLTSREVLCNGRLLRLEDDTALPEIAPVELAPGPSLSLPAYSIAFHVFRNAAPDACSAER